MRHSRIATPGALVVVAVLGGCRAETAPARGEAPPLAAARRACTAGDSARAVCLALETLERRDGQPRVVDTVERRGDTLCVLTGQAYPRTLDGDGAVLVVAGRVVSATEGDSLGCNWNPR